MVARRAGISGCCLLERQPGYEKISSYYNLESEGIIQPVKQSLAELHKRSYKCIGSKCFGHSIGVHSNTVSSEVAKVMKHYQF